MEVTDFSSLQSLYKDQASEQAWIAAIEDNNFWQKEMVTGTNTESEVTNIFIARAQSCITGTTIRI